MEVRGFSDSAIRVGVADSHLQKWTAVMEAHSIMETIPIDCNKRRF